MTVQDSGGETGRIVSTASGRNETVEQRSDRNWNELLQEVRVMETGVQILTGFLLVLPFQQRFQDLESYQRAWYLVLVVLAVLTTGLAIAPVATHRAVFRKHLKPRLVTAADRMVRGALVLLSLLLSGALGLVFDVVIGPAAGIVLGLVAIVVLVGMWVVWPAVLRFRHTEG